MQENLSKLNRVFTKVKTRFLSFTLIDGAFFSFKELAEKILMDYQREQTEDSNTDQLIDFINSYECYPIFAKNEAFIDLKIDDDILNTGNIHTAGSISRIMTQITIFSHECGISLEEYRKNKAKNSYEIIGDYNLAITLQCIITSIELAFKQEFIKLVKQY